jgi:hypothetical protein
MVDDICLDGVKNGLESSIVTVSSWYGEALKVIGSDFVADDKIDCSSGGF